MLSNSLKNMGINSEQCAQWLQRAGVDGKRRAETLSLEDFAALTNTFSVEKYQIKKDARLQNSRESVMMITVSLLFLAFSGHSYSYDALLIF